MKKKPILIAVIIIISICLCEACLRMLAFFDDAPPQETKTASQLLTQKADPDATPMTIQKEDSIDGINRITVKSNVIEDTFVIDIITPKNYDFTKKYPVLYLTDGNYRRTNYKDIQALSKDGSIVELIIVGICYPDGYDIDTIRTRDFVFHARDFLMFIVNDIVPYINENYSTDQINQTLYGTSLGGFFAAYCMLQNEGLTKNIFQNYIISSPTFTNKTDNLSLFEYEDELSNITQELKLNVYLTVGSLEYEDFFQKPIKEFSQSILSHDYKGLNYKTMSYEGLDHNTAWKQALLDGLKMFLAPTTE